MDLTDRWQSLAVLVITALLIGPPSASAQPRETTGVITEIKVGQGKADVKPLDGQWRAAAPLLALRAGDAIRTTENAAVVVVLSGGRGVVRIDARNSRWVAPAVREVAKAQKAEALVASGLAYLSRTATDAPEVLLSTRAGGGPPRIVSPRDSSILGPPVVFEWAGSQFVRYTVRVTSANGVVLERTGLAGARFAYPDDAPPLAPGVRYTFEVEARHHKPQTTTFEVVDVVRRAAVRTELADLETSLGVTATPTSIAAVKAGALASMGLVHDARLVVLAALAADPDEPTLHAILGTLYLETGLEEQAAAAFSEANSLLGRRR